jgi:hypothetical protein
MKSPAQIQGPPQQPHPSGHVTKPPSRSRYSSYSSYSPLIIRRKKSSLHLRAPPKVEKLPHKPLHSPNMCAWPLSAQMQSDMLSRKLDATSLEYFNSRVSSEEMLASSRQTAQAMPQMTEHFEYAGATTIQNNYPSDFDEVMSPLSTDYRRHPNTPLCSSPPEDGSYSQSSSDETDFASYQPYHAVQPRNNNIYPTPPMSQHLSNGPWTHERRSSLPEPSEGDDKAELRWDGNSAETESSHAESTCGASVSNPMGLGIVNTSSGISSNMRVIDQWSTATNDNRPCFCPTPCLYHAAMTSVENGPLVQPTFSAAASSNPSFAMSPLYLQRRSSISSSSPTIYSHRQTDQALEAPSSLIRELENIDISVTSVPQTPPSSPLSPTAPQGCSTSNHRRSKSGVHHRRRPSANNVPKSPQAGMGFVNYTPHDRRKILTGVAPSGSSKTKARREKEALEKRRKLSEAAKKAVLEAGGDLEALERECLLVMESGI